MIHINIRLQLAMDVAGCNLIKKIKPALKETVETVIFVVVMVIIIKSYDV